MSSTESARGFNPLLASRPDGVESARVAALRTSGLLDTAPEVAFDDVVRLASQLCAAPLAMVGLVDAERTWFKAQIGFSEPELPRSVSLCALAIDGPLIIEDTLADPRSAHHPLVTGSPHVRFFAGVPLRTADGHAIGALGVGDVRARPLTAEQEYGLHALARTASRQIGLHRHACAIETLLSERTALLRIAHLVGGVAEVPERLRRICGELARLTGADTASAYMLDPSGSLLQPVAAYHVPKWALEELARTPIPVAAEGFAEAAFHQRQVVWSDDVGRDPRFPQAMVRRFPHRTGIVVPMVVDENVTGGFYLAWWERARAMTATEAALLQTVGLHVGLFLRSARLRADLEARNQRLSTLIQLNQEVSSTLDSGSILTSIARATEQLLEAEQVAVWTADESRRRLTLATVSRVVSEDFPLTELGYDDGATGWVATRNALLNLDDVYGEGSPILHPERWRRAGLRTFLGVPVVLDGKLLAVLAIAGRQPFLREPGARDLVDMFASQTAVALRNASLHAEALAARTAAETAARANADFLAVMSHELRTPLTGVVGAAQLLLATALRPEQHDLVETLQQSAEALRNVVGDVLDLAKIEAGKFELDTVDFEPRALVETAVDGFAHAAASKGIDLAAVAAPPVAEAVMGDRHRLGQVLGNLVGNAVRCTDQGQVVVRATTGEHAGRVELRVEVADSGVGIAPGERQRLFQPYAQVDPSPESTGLGLAICRRLVEAMGGRIGVDSEPGRGSTFWFTVPLILSTRARGALPPRELPPARVLLVETGRATQECIAGYLASWGLTCVTLDDGTQALAALRDAAAEGTPFDVVIVGQRLGGEAGDALAHAIQTIPSLAGVSLLRLRPLGETTGVSSGPWRMTLRTPVHHRALRDGLARALAPRDDGGDAARGTPIPSPAQAPLHLRVLVVDDDRTSQKVAALMLRALGCDADIVADGPTAIAASDSGVYDAILMDCSMPAMDGPAATREIRRRGTGRPHPAIIAVTASAAKTDRDRCFDAGMDDYLTKPITIEALRAALVRMAGGPPALQVRPANPGALPVDEPVHSGSMDLSGFVGTGDPPAEVARLFLSEAPRQLEDVREALARRDHAALAWAAHRLKGAVANFEGSSALETVQHLSAMEESGVSAPRMDATWPAREREFERLTVALTELLDEISRSTRGSRRDAERSLGGVGEDVRKRPDTHGPFGAVREH